LTNQKPQKKKGLAPLRNEEAPEGSRVTITYNEPLSDYSAYRKGDRFVVVIPKAEAPRVRNNMRGRGFDGVQVERRGEDTVLSFRIQPGAGARVAQQFNKLEVVFSAPNQTASNPAQTSSAASSANASKAAQTKQATGIAPQTFLNNHNSTADKVNQPNNAKAGAVSAGASAAQEGTTAATGDSSLKPSTASSPAQSHEAQAATAQSPPAAVISPSAEQASTGTALTSYWLPLLIAALLLASAYMVIAERRRTERDNNMEAVAPAAVTGEVVADALAPLPESLEEIRSSDEELEPVRRIEPGETETELVKEAMPDVMRQDVLEDEAPEPTAFDLETAASSFQTVGPVAFESTDDHQNGATPSTLIDDEMPLRKAVEIELAQANPVESFVGGMAAAHAVALKEPVVTQRDAPDIPSTTLRYLGSEDANERAAGVLDLADVGNDDAYTRIGAAFDDPVQQVRDAAARALFNINEDRADSFKRIMRVSSPERRRRIGAAIASSGMAGEAISDLTSQSGERAYDALLVLSLMAKAGEVQSLIETIEDHPSTEVRLAIVKLLALSGQPDILKTFRYLATRDSLPIAVRSSIMEAIYQLNNPHPFELSS
jgi:hypothetical protein